MGGVERAKKGGKGDVNTVFMYEIILKINNLN